MFIKRKKRDAMSQIPRISGWPSEYPSLDPKTKAFLVLNDLKELDKDSKLASSQSWLSMFAKNALELDHIMDQLHQSKSFPKALQTVNNWFKNAEEGLHSLSEVLFDLQESHFRKMTPLQKFIQLLVKKDQAGLHQLINHLEEFLQQSSQ